jgi:hypothetical protein
LLEDEFLNPSPREKWTKDIIHAARRPALIEMFSKKLEAGASYAAK